jgi:hypothetical protein
VANTVGENAMTLTIVNVLGIVAILLSPTVSATYYYDADDIQQQVITHATRQNIDPSLALAVAKVESNFNPQALSHAGAKGVMQIMPRTAEQVFGVSRSRLFEPDINIELGVKFIKKLLERYDGRLDIALSHYNGGSGVKNRHGELNVLPKTRDYVDKVLATQQGFLQHDNQRTLTSQVNQSGIRYMYGNNRKFLEETQVSDTHSQDPQIETLRALRLHNITRNYKGKKERLFTGKPRHFDKPPSVHTSLNAKIAKVRQWESIYLD